DTVSVADALEVGGKLSSIGISYLSELAEGVPSAANCEYYAKIIKRDSLIRKVIEAGNDIAKKGYECADGAEALDNAERLVYQIAEQKSDKVLTQAGSAFAEALKNIQDAQTGNIPSSYIFTGYKKFDRMTSGLKPGELVFLAARPSVGKTAFALNIVSNVCVARHKKVAIFSLEMQSFLLSKRMLAYESQVSLTKMNNRSGLNIEDEAKIYKAYSKLSNAPLYIDDYSMNTPGDILSKCRRMKHEVGLDLVVIDYLQLMSVASSGSSRPESRQVEVSEMSRKLKIYAKELEVPILVLSQLSRSVEVRKEEPQLSDLRESGSIEQDADIVMFLHDPSKLNQALPPNQIKLLIRKNRNGNIGDIMLDWDGDTTSFKELETDDSGKATYENDTESAVAKPLKRSQSKEIKAEDMPFDGNANAEPQNSAKANDGATSKSNEGYAKVDTASSASNSRDNGVPWDTNETTIEKNERKNKEINEILDADDEYVDDIDSSNEYESSGSQGENA
ncbi:MAG: replicative DNA helicase, partial [Clostridia bacterium]